MSKYKSRKFVVAWVQLTVVVLLPVVYKLLGIADDVTMICLTASAGLSGIYIGSNAFGRRDDGQH